MNAVFLSPNVPYPPLNGGHHRNLGLIRSLARFASVHVFAAGDPRDGRVEEARRALAAWDATIDVFPPTGPGPAEADLEDTARRPDAAAHFRSPELADALRHWFASHTVDVAHVEEVVMAQYLDLLPCPRVIDRQKIDWAYHEAMAGVVSAGSLDHLREAARFRRWERDLVGAFERILVPGEGDRRLLEPLHGLDAVAVVPIAIADELAPPARSGRRVDHVLLYGALDYGPNVEAQRWYFDKVWPALRSAAPELRTLIVGSGRPPLTAAMPPDDPRVETRGFVADIQGVLQGSGVLVVGVQVGGGARTKILEALACGMPVVSTALGVENIGLVSGRDFLLAENATEMTEAVLHLVRDPNLAASLGREGAARAEAFRWSRVEKQIEPIFREVAARTTPPDAPLRPAPAGGGWDSSSEVVRLKAELTELRRSPVIRATQAFRRAKQRLRRSSPVARAEAFVARMLDGLLTPGGEGKSRFKAGLARALRRLASRAYRTDRRPS